MLAIILENLKTYIFKKNKVFLLFVVSTVMIKKNKEESIEILKILGLITNKAEY